MVGVNVHSIVPMLVHSSIATCPLPAFCGTVHSSEIPYPVTHREASPNMKVFRVMIFALCCGFVLRK